MTEDDILVVSLGGNDIALRPTKKTIFSIASAIALNFLSFGFAKYPPGMGHFENLFGKQVEKFIKKLTKNCKPKMVLVCMLYYLDENPKAESWSNTTLKALRYNSKPQLM